MVKPDDIQKVLIIPDKKYLQKAEHITRGVGTETQTISPKHIVTFPKKNLFQLLQEKMTMGIFMFRHF